jgi:hypothetical protein
MGGMADGRMSGMPKASVIGHPAHLTTTVHHRPGEPRRMTMYWIYDIPNWQLAALIVAGFVAASLAGLFATRPLARRVLEASPAHNDVVSYIFAGVGVFYGLALGLIAVATWENFNDVDGLVSKEAADLAELYRDLDGYPQPLRGRLEARLRDYTRHVIEKEWPAHRGGLAPEDGTQMLDGFENEMMAFDPSRETEKICHAEAMRSLDSVVEQRRLRLQAVGTGLPASLWSVVLIGAALTVALTYLFWVENLTLHAILVAALATFIALLVFLTAAMDNPFRGEFSVAPDALQTVLDEVMTARSGG